MKIKINTKKIKALNPCQNRFDNWLKHYKNWSGDILEFLALPDEIITVNDKLWVALRVVSKDIIEYFAFDMAVDAAIYATDVAAYTIYAAIYAICAADADAYAESAAGHAAAYAESAAVYAAKATFAYAVEAAVSASLAAAYASGAGVHATSAADIARERQRQKALDTLAYLIATH